MTYSDLDPIVRYLRHCLLERAACRVVASFDRDVDLEALREPVNNLITFQMVPLFDPEWGCFLSLLMDLWEAQSPYRLPRPELPQRKEAFYT